LARQLALSVGIDLETGDHCTG